MRANQVESPGRREVEDVGLHDIDRESETLRVQQAVFERRTAAIQDGDANIAATGEATAHARQHAGVRSAGHQDRVRAAIHLRGNRAQEEVVVRSRAVDRTQRAQHRPAGVKPATTRLARTAMTLGEIERNASRRGQILDQCRQRSDLGLHSAPAAP